MLYQRLKNYWAFILKIGWQEDLSYINKLRLKILNQQSFYTLFIILLLIIKTLIEGEEDLWIIVIIFLLAFGMPLLNFFRRYFLAKLYWLIFFPTIMFGVIALYGEILHGELTFFIFVVTGLIFFDGLWVRMVVVLFSVVLLLGSMYYIQHFESPYADFSDELDRIFIFIVTTSCITSILSTFLNEINRYIQVLQSNQKKLESAYQEIERFAYISSHHLKTPIRSISSFTDLILRDVKKNKLDDLPEYLSYIKQGANQMQLLITNILEFSSIKPKDDFKLEEVDLNYCLSTSITKVLTNGSKPIKIQKTHLPSILSNTILVSTIFQNIIDNAVKFNHQSTIEIKIDSEIRDYNIIISFSDNGIGIEHTYHERIFRLFEKLHHNSEYEGTGIGLALCRKIIHQLDGRIWLASNVGLGSTFYVELPCFLKKKKNIDL